MYNRYVFRLFTTITLITGLLASATEAADNQPDDDWRVSTMLGVAVSPLYLGDDEVQLSLIPDLRVEYRDRFFASLLGGIGYNIIATEHWQAGPVIKYDFGRDEQDGTPLSISGDDPTDLLGLGDIDGSAEAGGFLAYQTQHWRTKLEVRQGLDGGHEGLIGSLEAKWTGQSMLLNKPLIYSIGPEVVYGDASYQQAYFGITSIQSIGSGLDEYTADAGIVSYGLHANLIIAINDKWMIGCFASVDKLGSQASDSPLVIERGSDNQAQGGLFFSYQF